MSAGAFLISKYEADTTSEVYPIKVQPETLTFVFDATNNAPTTTPLTSSDYVYARGATQRYGIKARRVTIKWIGVVPDGYEPTQRLSVPILTKALYDDIRVGAATATYLGQSCQVVGKTDERRR